MSFQWSGKSHGIQHMEVKNYFQKYTGQKQIQALPKGEKLVIPEVLVMPLGPNEDSRALNTLTSQKGYVELRSLKNCMRPPPAALTQPPCCLEATLL